MLLWSILENHLTHLSYRLDSLCQIVCCYAVRKQNLVNKKGFTNFIPWGISVLHMDSSLKHSNAHFLYGATKRAFRTFFSTWQKEAVCRHDNEKDFAKDLEMNHKKPSAVAFSTHRHSSSLRIPVTNFLLLQPLIGGPNCNMCMLI